MELRKKITMKSSLPPYWERFKTFHEEVEKHVQNREGSYQNLPFAALYSSLDDLLNLYNHPLIQGNFADLGCGSGLAPLLYGSIYPDRKSIGVEFELPRLNIGLSFKEDHHLNNVSLIHADLLSCDIPVADVYFLYFPTGPVLDRILASLYSSQKAFHLLVIESHGDLIPRLSLENWLDLKDEIPLISQRHYPKARIYERLFIERNAELLPFSHTFLPNYLLIADGDELWIGETMGMEWTSGKRFELKTPPRTVLWDNVKKLMTMSEIEQKYHSALSLRRVGEVEITTSQRILRGIVRKILVHPTFRLEISTGEKVEWKEILTITQGSSLCYESSQAFSS